MFLSPANYLISHTAKASKKTDASHFDETLKHSQRQHVVAKEQEPVNSRPSSANKDAHTTRNSLQIVMLHHSVPAHSIPHNLIAPLVRLAPFQIAHRRDAKA